MPAEWANDRKYRRSAKCNAENAVDNVANRFRSDLFMQGQQWTEEELARFSQR